MSVLTALSPSPADFIEWDVATWSRALAFWDTLDIQGRALDIGARRGGLSLWLALKGCDVVCSDLWGSHRAKPLHDRHGVTVTYEDIDATAIPYRDEFDVVVIKSVLPILGDQQARAIAQMHAALKPRGVLLFAENLAGSPVHRLARACFRPDTWRYLSLEGLRRLLRPFERVEIHTTGFLSAFGVREAHRQALARIDIPVPASWRYVGYGAAWKH